MPTGKVARPAAGDVAAARQGVQIGERASPKRAVKQSTLFENISSEHDRRHEKVPGKQTAKLSVGEKLGPHGAVISNES